VRDWFRFRHVHLGSEELVLDSLRVLLALPTAELCRRFAGPAWAVAHLRARGRNCAPRTPAGRVRLRRFIRAVDVRLPDGGNCYRRALVEIALDPDSAAEPLHLGLIRRGGPRSGHAWLASDPPAARVYDAELTI